ncbi:MAG: BrnT family toxin [Zoogloeaceae bacterium]|jgi:uncharacterized DUF497 family protein|nr:BrnT family toxin [Zoogloeaceae bacterium]
MTSTLRTDIEGVSYSPVALTRAGRDSDEARFVTLGMDGTGRLPLVGYPWRGEDVRVFSARKTQRESKEER